MQKKIEDGSLPRWLLVIVVFAIGIAVALLCTYFYQFWGSLSIHQEVWAQFGDYLGGILNPLFSIVGLCALLYTIRLQSREMANSTRELERSADALKRQGEHSDQQKFDSRLFHLVSLHSQTLSNLSFSERKKSNGTTYRLADAPREFKGDRAIKYLVDDLIRNYFDSARAEYDLLGVAALSRAYSKWKQIHWDYFYKYFVSVRNLVAFLRSYEAGSSEPFPAELIKSQLNMDEALLLLLVSVFEEGAEDVLLFLCANNLGFNLFGRKWFSSDLSDVISERLDKFSKNS